jgi:hypothetical protein
MEENATQIGEEGGNVGASATRPYFELRLPDCLYIA